MSQSDNNNKKKEKKRKRTTPPQRRLCNKVNKKRGDAERETDKRRYKRKRARGQLMGDGGAVSVTKEVERM